MVSRVLLSRCTCGAPNGGVSVRSGGRCWSWLPGHDERRIGDKLQRLLAQVTGP